MQYQHLISGSDLRGVALDGFGKEVTLNAQVAASAVKAFVALVRRQTGAQNPRIAVGHDPRLSWPDMVRGAKAGCAAADAVMIDCGLCTTPAMFMSTIIGPKADGAIMITASHLPKERNGLKFMLATGGLTSAQIKEIVAEMEEVPMGEGKVESYDFLSEYSAFLGDFIAQGKDKPLSGMKIAVDAGNGSGGFFADVLTKLGAQVQGLYLDPDGNFPNHAPNPEEQAALVALSDAVVSGGAELGVIFDADCDRAALCDASGREINRNRLIALVAALILKEEPGATIVTDSVTSTGLAEFIAERGGVHCRFKRGYRNVIDEAVRLNAQGINSPVAIETSGHCALRNNHFLDDGAYLVAWLLRHIAAARSQGIDWTSWIAGLREPAEDEEIRVKLTNADFRPDGMKILEAIEGIANGDAQLTLAQDSFEGVRIYCPEGGWLMVRLSVHDPVLPINIQADHPGGAKAMAARLLSWLEPFANCADLSPLRTFIA